MREGAVEQVRAPAAPARARTETVAVVGLGYVGLPVAALTRRKGFLVLGYDVDAERVASLATGSFPLPDAEAADVFRDVPLDATTNVRRLAEADVVIVAVPTPVDEHAQPNLGPLKAAVETVARSARAGVLLSLESTVNPGVSEEVVVPLLRGAGRDPGSNDIFLVHCPERVNPGDPRWTVRNIPRVLGGYTEEATERGLRFYGRLLDAPIRRMSSIRAAEAVKIVENVFRDVNIAFVNELAKSFDRLGIDVVEVIDGASTKPFAFLPHFPGCGVGGHCIPVDPYYLIEHAESRGFDHRFLKLAREINRSMPAYTVERLKHALDQVVGSRPARNASPARSDPRSGSGERSDAGGQKAVGLHGVRLALLGLAYKRDVPDLRESPALEIEKILKAEGATVAIYDPFVPDRSSAHSLSEVLQFSIAVVLATDHTEFRALTPEQLKGTPVRVIVDGRNCLDRDSFRAAGYTIVGIGR